MAGSGEPRRDAPDFSVGSDPASAAEDEYAALLAAMTATARGRAFLAEYLRRNSARDQAPTPATALAAAGATPAFEPEPLAPIMAMSPEERLALFS